MRYYPAKTTTILLFHLTLGVFSQREDKCVDVDKKYIPEGLIDPPFIKLDSATQEQIDNLHSLIKGEINAWYCAYGIKMSGNTEVSHLKLPPIVFSLEVTENPSLSTMTIPQRVVEDITVTRNNKLNSNVQQLEDLRKLCQEKKCNVQEPNECWFENSVYDASDLEHCSKIRTDLFLVRMEAEVPTKFTEIKCLSVINTGVTNLDFLKDLTTENIKCDPSKEKNIVLEDNENLCLSHTQAKAEISKLSDKFLVKGNNNPKCETPLECSYADAVEAVDARDDSSCNVITGDVEIDCSSTATRFHFNQFHKLSGTLTLTKCSSDEALERITYFKEIDAGQGVAVTLKDPRDNLEKFANGNFRRIILKGRTILKVDSKTQIAFIEATRIRNALERSIGEASVEFTNVEPGPTGEGVCVVSKRGAPLPEDCTIVHGDLFLDENTEKVNPNLEEVKGCIKMYGTKKLTDYSFLKDLTVGKKCLYSKGTHDIKRIGCIPLEVRRSIKKELLDIIMDKDNDNNLNCECFYKDPVTEIKESCKLIDGDLIVDKNTQTIPSGIEEVTGCIHVSKDATIDLSFLKTIKTFSQSCLYRKDKSGIDVECVPYSLLNSISKDLEITSNHEAPREECGECKAGKVQEFDPKCKIVIGHLLVEGVKNGDVEEKMKNVEEIYGALTIRNTEADKIEFPKLKKIVMESTGVPLEITNNTNLITLELPALESISSNGQTLIRIEENPEWKSSDSMQNSLKKVVPEGCSEAENSKCVFKEAKIKGIDISHLSNLGFIENGKIVLNSATQSHIDELAQYVKDQKKNAWIRGFPIVMTGNSGVTNLKLPPYVFDLTVTNNPKLINIEGQEFVEGTAVITGNNALNKQPQILMTFRGKFCSGSENIKENVFKSCQIQKEDECWFGREVQDAVELEGCASITSDLKLFSTKGDISGELKSIQCLSVKNTSLTNLHFLEKLEKVDCLQKDQLVIEDNEFLCMSYTEAKKFLSKYTEGFSVKRNYNKETCSALECTFADFKEASVEEPDACKSVKDDVILDCSDDSEEKYRIPVLNGTLTLVGCSTEQILARLENFQLIDGGESVSLTLKNPTDNLKDFRNYSTKLVGAKWLKVDNEDEFTLIDATRVKIAVATEEQFFDKVDFVKVAETPQAGCVVTNATVKLPENCKIVVGDLILNHLTESVNPVLEEVQGCLQMHAVSKVDNYDFLKNVKIGSECLFKSGNTEIKENGCIPLEVRRSMKQEILLNLIMQPENGNNAQCECFYNSAITEIPGKCKLIDGDLIVDSRAGTIPNVIEEVTGCIRISNETNVDLSFLQGIKTFSEECLYSNYSTGIEAECIPPSVLEVMTSSLSAKIPSGAKSTPRQKCGECQGGNVLEIASNCKIVYGDVKVEGVKESSEVVKTMAKVEEIFGRLIIQNNDAERIVFPALKKVTVIGSQEAPVEIVDNKNLVSVELPALESITVDGPNDVTLIKIEKNPKWNPSKPVLDKLQGVAGECSEAKGSRCFLKHVKEESKNPDGKAKDSEEEDDSKTLIIVLSVVGVTVVVLSVGAGIGVFVYIRRRKNKGNADKKTETRKKVSKKNTKKQSKNDQKSKEGGGKTEGEKKDNEKKDASPAGADGQSTAPPTAPDGAATSSAAPGPAPDAGAPQNSGVGGAPE